MTPSFPTRRYSSLGGGARAASSVLQEEGDGAAEGKVGLLQQNRLLAEIGHRPLAFVEDAQVPGQLLAPFAAPGHCGVTGRQHRARLADALGQRALARREALDAGDDRRARSEEHTSEIQSLMRSSSAHFCLKKTRHKHS